MRAKDALRPGFITALCVLLCGAAGMTAMIIVGKFYLQKLPIEALDANGRLMPFSGLPNDAPGFEVEGTEAVLSAEVVEELGTQNYLSRWYVEKPPEEGAPDGARRRRFELHLAYYTGKVDTVPHVPERCYVGGGMDIVQGSRIVGVPLEMDLFPLDQDVDREVHGPVRQGRTLSHTYTRLPVGLDDLRMNITGYRDQSGRAIYAGYFFIANGSVMPTAEDVRSFAFNLKDSYAYYAKVQFMSPDVSSAEELAALAGGFLDEMLPEIALRTPDWVAVQQKAAAEGRARKARTDDRD